MATKRKTTKRKTKKTKATTTGVKSGTLAELAGRFVEHLTKAGKSTTTVRGYASDLKVAMKVLGADIKIAAIGEKELARFDESAAVTRTRAGTPKAAPGVARMRATLRRALAWTNGR